MFEWQSQEWLRDLATASDKQRSNIWREISDSCEFTEAGYMEMAEKDNG
jgi:hypothetical protein